MLLKSKRQNPTIPAIPMIAASPYSQRPGVIFWSIIYNLLEKPHNS
jgi:hypothetical protein